MLDPKYFLNTKLIVKLIVFCALLLSFNSLLFAETYSVPQTTLVTLAWDANDPAPDGYNIYQRSEGQTYDYNQPVWTTSNTTATVYNLEYDTTYYYVVRAYVGSDESGDSNEVPFNTPSSSTGTTTYTITSNISGSGAILPAGPVSVTEGADQTFEISAGTGSYIVDVLVDGTSVGPVTSYTFTQVGADHAISAEFAALPYTISASAGSGGTISPSGDTTVSYGASQSYVITPDAGYHVADVIVDGASMGPVTTYTFGQVIADHFIQATFATDEYVITSSAGNGGTISPSGSITVSFGASQSYVITPDAGYHVADVIVDGASMGPVTSYTFDQVAEAHSIQATFTADEYTISSSAVSGGAITPSGTTVVTFGSSQTYTIIPDPGFMISNVVVDDLSAGAVNSYTFSSIDSDHTITALFVATNQAPVTDAGPDQTVDEGSTVTLSGLNSTDPDDGIASFQWRQVQGIEVVLTSPTEPETTFIAPNVDDAGAALVFELTVTDYSGVTSVDSCIVNVTWVNVPPIADAGMDQTVMEGSEVLLDASGSTDADNGIVSYAWKQLAGPTVTLINANSATPTFISPNVGTAGAAMTFEVTVTDAGGLQDTDTCLINLTWVNAPPVAVAGADQDATIGTEVQLDGSQSYDDDDTTIASFKWRQTEGAPVELSDATAQNPVFVVPAGAVEGSPLTFELTVTDSGGLQATDLCQVNVIAAGPQMHIADITMTLDQKGPTLQVHAYATVLDGDGIIVKQATVTGTWYLDDGRVSRQLNVASSDTRGDGAAKLDSDKLKVRPGAIFTLEITGITKDGYTYEPASNVVTIQSISIP